MKTCAGCVHDANRMAKGTPCRECIGTKDLPRYTPATTPTSTPKQCLGCSWTGPGCCQETTAPANPEPRDAGTSRPERGLRYNTGKRRYDLLPPDTMALLADLLTKGAEKYAERNWELGMPYSDALASLERHLMDWKAGIDCDDESGMSHMVHVMCNAMFLATWQQRGRGSDDRKKVAMPKPYAPASNPRGR